MYICSAQGVKGRFRVMIEETTMATTGKQHKAVAILPPPLTRHQIPLTPHPSPHTSSPHAESDEGVSTTVIIIAASLGGGALLIFLMVLVMAACCLCCHSKNGSKQPRRTQSIRPKHWADASGSHTGPRAHDKRGEVSCAGGH